ncbi:MAG: ribosome-binding factor A [bacterium]|jgi:ribosome-binding factor A
MVMSRRVQEMRRNRKKSFYLRELSSLLSRLVYDEPRLLNMYFTRIELSEDGSVCYVYCAFLNAESAEQGQTLFEEARELLVLYKGSMRTALAGALSARYVPQLRFVFDEKKEKEQRINDLLNHVGAELDQYDSRKSDAVAAAHDDESDETKE